MNMQRGRSVGTDALTFVILLLFMLTVAWTGPHRMYSTGPLYFLVTTLDFRLAAWAVPQALPMGKAAMTVIKRGKIDRRNFKLLSYLLVPYLGLTAWPSLAGLLDNDWD